MALVSTRRVVLSNNAVLSQIRGYAKNSPRAKEEIRFFNKFKKELRSSRVVFQKELKSQQQMNMEEFSAHAAEEARLAREVEEKALEDNRIELERMSRKRQKDIERAEKKRLEMLGRGAITREAWEKSRINARAKEVIQVQGESLSFITMDNMEQKIKEIIDNEVDYNYALTKTGEKITTRNKIRLAANT